MTDPTIPGGDGMTTMTGIAAELDVERLREHEADLVAFGRFMVNADSHDPRNVDYAEMGRLAAEVINGIPIVRAAIKALAAALSPSPEET
jgi:hypothetical protein